MNVREPSMRTTAAVALVLQLLLAVGVPLADASHGIESERRTHVEQKHDAPCSTDHAAHCQLARVLATNGVPLPPAAAAVPDAALPVAMPADLPVDRGVRLISSHGPRAPPRI